MAAVTSPEWWGCVKVENVQSRCSRSKSKGSKLNTPWECAHTLLMPPPFPLISVSDDVGACGSCSSETLPSRSSFNPHFWHRIPHSPVLIPSRTRSLRASFGLTKAAVQSTMSRAMQAARRAPSLALHLWEAAGEGDWVKCISSLHGSLPAGFSVLVCSGRPPCS